MPAETPRYFSEGVPDGYEPSGFGGPSEETLKEPEYCTPLLRQRIGDYLKDCWPIAKMVDEDGIQRAVDIVERSGMRERVVPGGIYLDIGTGIGHIMEEVANKEDGKDIRILAFDPVFTPQKRAAERLRKRGNKVLFAKARGEQLPVQDKSVDGVSLFFVLHHIPRKNWPQIFDEIKRVLKDGGQVFLTEDTPGNEEEARRNVKWDKRMNNEPGGMEHYYNGFEDWEKILEENGFEIVESRCFKSVSKKKTEGEIHHTSFVLRKSNK